MKFYQQIMIYGGPGSFTVKLAGGEERTFRTYNEALLAVIEYLASHASFSQQTPNGPMVFADRTAS
jgi:hypothetical protein